LVGLELIVAGSPTLSALIEAIVPFTQYVQAGPLGKHEVEHHGIVIESDGILGCQLSILRNVCRVALLLKPATFFSSSTMRIRIGI
jgi:hypothetical protein